MTGNPQAEATVQRQRGLVPNAVALTNPINSRIAVRLDHSPEPKAPPKEAHFISYCRLLPPREFAKSFSTNGMVGRGGGDRTRPPNNKVPWNDGVAAARQIQLLILLTGPHGFQPLDDGSPGPEEGGRKGAFRRHDSVQFLLTSHRGRAYFYCFPIGGVWVRRHLQSPASGGHPTDAAGSAVPVRCPREPNRQGRLICSFAGATRLSASSAAIANSSRLATKSAVCLAVSLTVRTGSLFAAAFELKSTLQTTRF